MTDPLHDKVAHMQRTFQFGQFSTEVVSVTPDLLFTSIPADAAVICDSNTRQFVPKSYNTIEIPAGEIHKSWEKLHFVLQRLLESRLTRASTVVGIGGGVITDLAACAASLYMRGCSLVLIPSSLLAMVDAALGGKTGVNFGGFKNMIGTFYPAQRVIVAPGLLATLSEREYRSGLAEVVKTAMLGDAPLLDLLEQRPDAVLARDPDLVARAVEACVVVKGKLVEQDLRESGVRAHLNLGHTFAHALESVAGLGEWTHGEAVAWGLARAVELSVREGLAEEGYAKRITTLLTRYGYTTESLPALAEQMKEAMKRDKKRTGAQVRFVLQRGPEQTLVSAVEQTNLNAVMGL